MDQEQAERALTEATERIADLERQVSALLGERDTAADRTSALEATQAALEGRLAETAGAHETLTASLEETRQALSAASERGLTHLRRALLAEHAGLVVPELVSGSDEATLLASVDLAKQAHCRALEAARATLAHQTVPAGAPSLRSVSSAGLTPLEMIESGLRK